MTSRHLKLGLPLHTIAGYFVRREVCVDFIPLLEGLSIMYPEKPRSIMTSLIGHVSAITPRMQRLSFRWEASHV
jgi:hypothetical protein